MNSFTTLNPRSSSAFLPIMLVVLTLLIVSGAPVTADQPPVFIEHPGSHRTPVGMSLLLSAQVSSALPVDYQWWVNDFVLDGRTGNTLDLFCVSMTQAGEVYTVVARNSAGAVTSAPALLEVFVPDSGRTSHTWGVNPAAQRNHFSPYYVRDQVGSIFHVDVFELTQGAIWGTDTYTDDSSLPAVAVHTGLLPVGQRGTVSMRISGPQAGFSGSTRNGITSMGYGGYGGSYQLLGVVPTITRHPKSQVRMVGAEAVFAVEAYGSGPLRYQWKHNGEDLPGETNATLQFAVDAVVQAGSYAVNVTDDNGMNTSDHAVLGVLPYTVGAPQAGPGPLSGYPGAFGRMVLTGNTNDGTIWGVGFYTTDMSITPAVVHDGLLQHDETGVIAMVRMPYQPFFLGDTLNGVTSLPYGAYPSVAFLGRVPNVIVNPLSQALLPGRTTQLEVEATHPDPFTIQWRKNGQKITGATQSQLTVGAESPGETAIYDVIVSVPGNPNVTQPARIITPPASAQTVAASDPGQVGAFASQPGVLITTPLTGSTNFLPVWGTGIYAFDSDLATAAVHAGLLAPGQSGQVTIYTLGYWPTFYGSTLHGVSTREYGGWTAFAFVTPGATPVQSVLTLANPGQLAIANATGHICQIWASPSLTPGTWSLLDSFVPTASPQAWVHTNAPPTQMFYRAIVLP